MDSDALIKETIQAAGIDQEEVSRLFQQWVGRAETSVDYSHLRPAPYVALDDPRRAQALQLGEEALRAGRVAAFTVAGGQGTRLGYNGPKGEYPATPVRDKPLFQLFAEKIRAMQIRYGRRIHWLIMTSLLNDAATQQFFADNGYFGLAPQQVRFFTQGQMPAVDAHSGQVLLAEPGRVAMSPDGHGGSLRALVRSGSIDFLKENGVDTLSYFQVDNPLVQCVDPVFIGLHLQDRAEISSKMVRKAYAAEKVGHFCLQTDGRQAVVEYSDLPQALQERTDPDTGALYFVAGSIAIHVLDVDFVARVGGGGDTSLALPFHFAHKKVPYVDAAGNRVSPEGPNAVKFEMFIFDALPLAERSLIVETCREDEFSPIKNATGVDSAETSKLDQSAQALSWLAAVGENVEGLRQAEVSPLFALTAEQFAERWNTLPEKPEITESFYVEP